MSAVARRRPARIRPSPVDVAYGARSNGEQCKQALLSRPPDAQWLVVELDADAVEDPDGEFRLFECAVALAAHVA